MDKKNNCLATARPDLALEWHPDKNRDLTPYDVTLGSNKKVWWICSKGHEWEARINDRTRKNGRGCPYCSNRKASNDNCLATLNPDISKEWHYAKNGNITPSNITHGSHKKVWWICDKGHEWEAQIKDRTKKGYGCLKCRGERQSSLCEFVLFYYLKNIFEDAVNREKITPENIEVDIYIPSLNVAIEYDGEYYHRSKMKQDSMKNKILFENGIQLVRIREEGLPKIEKHGCYEIKCKQGSPEDIAFVLNKIKYLIKKNYQLKKSVMNKLEMIDNIDIESNLIKIMGEYKKNVMTNNLKDKYPEIVKEWNYRRNGNIKPEYFPPHSNRKIWWHCVA